MIDLTKIPLEEVQNLVNGTEDGRAVRIYANDGAGNYPIHGAIKIDQIWQMSLWHKNGSNDSDFTSLKFKPKTIDFAQLPVDTLVSFNGLFMHVARPPAIHNSVRLFCNGSDSLTTNGDSITVSCDKIQLIEGPKVAWEGGECPLPDRVEVEVCYRKHSVLSYRRTANCIEFDWSHTNSAGDIIWYKITGRIV